MEEAVRAAIDKSTCVYFYLNEIDVEYALNRPEDKKSVGKLKRVFERIGIRARKLITVLYRQKHAFYFRRLQRWEDYTKVRVYK